MVFPIDIVGICVWLMRQFVSDCIKEVWQWDIAGHRSPRWAYPYIIQTWQCRSEYISERIHDLHIFDSYPWCWEDTLPCIPQIKTEHCWFLIGAHVLCCLFSIASTYMMHTGPWQSQVCSSSHTAVSKGRVWCGTVRDVSNILQTTINTIPLNAWLGDRCTKIWSRRWCADSIKDEAG